jgi:hypothetical protein
MSLYVSLCLPVSLALSLSHTHARQAHDYRGFWIRNYNGFTMTMQIIIFTIFINSIYAKSKAQLQYRLVSV